MAIDQFERTIEVATGESIDKVRNTPICESRARAEERFGRPMTFRNGGEIFGSYDEADRAYDQAMRSLSVP